MSENVVCGLMFNQESMDFMNIIYPDSAPGLLSKDNVVQSCLDECLKDIYDLASLRYLASLSGAMRWPWSQEAAIIRIIPKNILKFDYL